MDVEQYLRFGVWSTSTAEDIHFQLTSVKNRTLSFNLNDATVIASGPRCSYIYQVTLGRDKTLSFEEGDIFGIRQSDEMRSKVALCHQIGGGQSYNVKLEHNYHNTTFPTSALTVSNIYPLIAIDTGKFNVHRELATLY